MFRWVDHLGGIANSQPYCDDKLIKQPLLLHFDLGVFNFMFAWPYSHPIPFPLCSVWDLQSNFELSNERKSLLKIAEFEIQFK